MNYVSILQFRLRTLFVVTALIAAATLPSYWLVSKLLQPQHREFQTGGGFRFTTINTAVSTPDGGTILRTGSGVRNIEMSSGD
ncbi:hypothetical protein Psta_0630 [Pirellula staleyi DSM 6068]|uniref:Uncharacterized protein n=1 Tax=Pirellula staleyi (strain ATCC 27377 / DSM 6068 / ICPB 4128) TaxID=530564 RepID=D2R4G9_PIRSD|nr:hypothetical protein Psta_0630 [Pirellula staleyi DSM 6068]